MSPPSCSFEEKVIGGSDLNSRISLSEKVTNETSQSIYNMSRLPWIARAAALKIFTQLIVVWHRQKNATTVSSPRNLVMFHESCCCKAPASTISYLLLRRNHLAAEWPCPALHSLQVLLRRLRQRVSPDTGAFAATGRSGVGVSRRHELGGASTGFAVLDASA